MGKHVQDSDHVGADEVLDDGETAQRVDDVPDGPLTGSGRPYVLDGGETAEVVESGEGRPTKGP